MFIQSANQKVHLTGGAPSLLNELDRYAEKIEDTGLNVVLPGKVTDKDVPNGV